MVMDATQPQQPSPQSVGREFVRQYYTLLNKAPNHLHRFYTNSSSFIHGESTLVVGQRNIHHRIQQLNFHDCHAKISQVDAQATLGNGVVVQVTGELSNDGQPMRRFTQTFVLAAQTPKKYYVHNDIFRYQDMYSDEDIDGESRSENDDEIEQQKLTPSVQTVVASSNDQQAPAVPATVAVGEPQQQPIQGQVIAGATGSGGLLTQQTAQPVYYSLPAAGGRPLAVLPPPPVVAAVPLANATFANATSGIPQQQQTAVQANAGGVSQLNGVVAHDEIISNIQPLNVVPATQMTNQTTSPVIMSQAAAPTVPVPVGSTTILSAQTAVGVAGVPVANAATAVLPQNIQNYQQSPIMQTHILQQQQQQQPPQQAVPPPQQQLPNANSQQQQLQSIPQQHPQQQQTQTPLSSSANTTIVDVDEISNSSNNITAEPQSRPNTAANVVASGQTISSSPNTVLESSPAPVVEDFKTINEQQQQEKYEAAKQQQQQQNEPKTYANLFKSTSSSPSSFVNAAMQQQQQIQQQQQQQQQSTVNIPIYPSNSNATSGSYSQSASSNTNSMSVYGNRNNDNSGPSLRQDNNNGQNSVGGPLPQRSSAKGFNKDFDTRRTSNAQFGDNQQLFLGNIPHHASEEELKSLFSRFGTVVDLRILSKSSGKIVPGGRNPLNYGFITYNDPEAVQNCLANCPLYFPENSPDGQKLNVEEKKPRVRSNDIPPRQNMGGSGMNNNISNNQRNMTSGGPPPRSLSNSGSGGNMMRGGNNVVNNSNTMSRGGSSGGSGGGAGPRMGGAFNRTSNGGNGSQMRGGNNNSQAQGNSYGVRR